MRIAGFWFVSLLVLAQPAGADTADLTRQVQALQQSASALDARLSKLEGTIQQNPQLLGLLQELELLKAEVAKLRGQAEVQVHQMDTLGKRQNDLYVDLDQRLSDLSKTVKPAPSTAAPAAVAPATPPTAVASPAAPAPSAAPALDPLDESRVYEASLAHFRDANYAAAIAGFKAFLKAYPDSALAANAQYWVGYSYYALKDYKSALAHQQKLVAAYPTSAKVPDALLNIASSMIALDDLANARKTLEELVAKHPGTNAANLATRRLAALK
ncbi:MAG: tol-pal system protein YbgF [Thiobacillus sp.]|nr:tol-pal system protein YbgF [Thiobacillus sp.]